jgi:hypothetical protein
VTEIVAPPVMLGSDARHPTENVPVSLIFFAHAVDAAAIDATTNAEIKMGGNILRIFTTTS